jgi:hypothetical protein
VSCNKLPDRYTAQQKAAQLKKYKLAFVTTLPTLVPRGVDTAILLDGFIIVGKPAAQNAMSNPTYHNNHGGGGGVNVLLLLLLLLLLEMRFIHGGKSQKVSQCANYPT